MTETHQTDPHAPRPGGGVSTDPPPAAPAAATDPAAAHRRANRDLWDAWTHLHLRLPPGGPHYDVAAFKGGRTTLAPIERGEVGDVAGKTLLHLQCHFGLDTLSWAREGATVTGADFSPGAVAAARALSAATGVPGRFVCADLYALPETDELRGARFDVVFTSYGVLSWLPDLAAWARVVARFLAPGGAFHLVEYHPFVYLLDPETHDAAGDPLDHGYFSRARPVRAASPRLLARRATASRSGRPTPGTTRSGRWSPPSATPGCASTSSTSTPGPRESPTTPPTPTTSRSCSPSAPPVRRR